MKKDICIYFVTKKVQHMYIKSICSYIHIQYIIIKGH